MSDHKLPQSQSPRQLSIFEVHFDERIRHVEIERVMHFSIFDTFQFKGSKGSAKNPHVYWRNARKNLLRQSGKEVLNQVLQHRFPGQGQRPTPVAPLKFFFRLAQVVEIKEWEPIREWMAEVAHERIEEEGNPGLGTARAYKRDLARLERAGYGGHEAAEYLRTRIASVQEFKALSATIAAICDHPNYGEIYNTEYLGLFNKTAAALKIILNTRSIRDKLPTMQLNALVYAESALKEVLKRANQLTTQEICSIAREICVPLGQQLQAICNMLGIDVVTGTPLSQVESRGKQ